MTNSTHIRDKSSRPYQPQVGADVLTELQVVDPLALSTAKGKAAKIKVRSLRRWTNFSQSDSRSQLDIKVTGKTGEYTESGTVSICWVQSVDLRDPWIALRNLWIPSLRRNPWMLARSMDFAYDANSKLIGLDIYSPIGNLH